MDVVLLRGSGCCGNQSAPSLDYPFLQCSLEHFSDHLTHEALRLKVVEQAAVIPVQVRSCVSQIEGGGMGEVSSVVGCERNSNFFENAGTVLVKAVTAV